MNKIIKIEIEFQRPVDIPPGFERALDALIGMICKKYEAENPKRVMWCAGNGSKPIWNEPNEPTFNDSVYHIEVAEREASEREIKRRKDRTAGREP